MLCILLDMAKKTAEMEDRIRLEEIIKEFSEDGADCGEHNKKGTAMDPDWIRNIVTG